MELVVVLNSKRLANIDIYFPTTAPAHPCTSDDSSSSVPKSAPIASLRARSRTARPSTATAPSPSGRRRTPRDGQPLHLIQRGAGDRPGAVVGNGSHVDPIAEKLELGYPARDALAEPLLLDFEKDDYDTPRVAGIVGVDSEDPSTNADGPGAVVGRSAGTPCSSRKSPNRHSSRPTRRTAPSPSADATDAAGAAREVYDLEFEHAVCAAGVAVDDGTFDVAVHNG